jgi:putative pyrroloquinoline-quinone binding quinoprotein
MGPARRFPIWLGVVLALVGVLGVVRAATNTVLLDDDASGGRAAQPINSSFDGLTTFRGNAPRTYYGEGPVPTRPVIRWRAPGRKMCSMSTSGLDGSELVEWCGTGWTGQPNVVPGERGVEIREGAYDRRYHFLGGDGEPVRPPLLTGDLAKGSATTDPDGFPLFYAGSRDDLLRVVAMDRPEPQVLFEIDANASVPRPLWNDDWDGAPLVIDDHLLEGGENGWFYVVRLHRSYGADGLVGVDPEIVARVPTFDDALLERIGDEDVSIESSVAFHDGVAYVANSAGLILGWDVSDVLAGGSNVDEVFRFWTGDDTDATVVVDDAGDLYVASEYQRFHERSRGLGQLMKLDPDRRRDPVVWSLDAPEIGFEGAGGSWSTPALWADHVYFITASGRVLSVDATEGHVDWEAQIAAPSIGSPVVVEGVLLQGDCSGNLHAWRLAAFRDPQPMWSLDLGECLESTPAVWDGWLYVGTREGYLFGIADPDTPIR